MKRMKLFFLEAGGLVNIPEIVLTLLITALYFLARSWTDNIKKDTQDLKDELEALKTDFTNYKIDNLKNDALKLKDQTLIMESLKDKINEIRRGSNP